MSRIGKKPVPIPKGVQVEVAGATVKVKGPKGALERRFNDLVEVTVEGSNAVVKTRGNDKRVSAMHGLTRSLLRNMVDGVTQGYSRAIEVQGVGYKASMQGRTLKLEVGYSHPVLFELPKGVDAKVDGLVVTLASIDKELLGQTCADIRARKPPEPYKGKGIRYTTEFVRRKEGKKAVG
ncbi:MAG TPA: 50S ribosomal protein L6 [Myxococcota bacterium]|jgi:large subunit ribosomal protein L6|nr:50S ribosomal protein L6 [Myxococcota bacterium]